MGLKLVYVVNPYQPSHANQDYYEVTFIVVFSCTAKLNVSTKMHFLFKCMHIRIILFEVTEY